MLHACAAKFDVTRNLKHFAKKNESKQGPSTTTFCRFHYFPKCNYYMVKYF